MDDEHKSEQVVDSIGIGKLYDPPDDFFDTFFTSDNGGLSVKEAFFRQRKGIKIEKVYFIPSQKHESGYPHIIGYKYHDPPPKEEIKVDNESLKNSEWDIVKVQDDAWPFRRREPIYAKTSITIGNPLPTKPGPIFVVDEIKTGTRLKFYKVWINGQERYLTENQLKYVKEA